MKKTASAEEIKKTYRKIVKESHPDLNPGDATGDERFKAAAAAYELLKDPEQRARFDRGETASLHRLSLSLPPRWYRWVGQPYRISIATWSGSEE